MLTLKKRSLLSSLVQLEWGYYWLFFLAQYSFLSAGRDADWIFLLSGNAVKTHNIQNCIIVCRLYTHGQELMKSVGSSGDQSLPFMWGLLSDTLSLTPTRLWSHSIVSCLFWFGESDRTVTFKMLLLRYLSNPTDMDVRRICRNQCYFCCSHVSL